MRPRKVQSRDRLRGMHMNSVKAATQKEELQRREGQRRAARAILTVCIGCGCDDMHACDGGCSWLRQDGERGVCSECPGFVTMFDAGARELSIEAKLEVNMRKEFGA